MNKKKNRRGTRFFLNWETILNGKLLFQTIRRIRKKLKRNENAVKLATFFSRDFWHLDQIDRMDSSRGIDFAVSNPALFPRRTQVG